MSAQGPEAGPLADRLARWGTRRTWTMLLLGLAFAGLGLAGTLSLHVDPDLKALLPPDKPSVARLREVSERLGSQSDLIVSIESPDRGANVAFGRALAERMRTLPQLRYVQFERDLDYFRDRALLYLPLPDLLELRRDVRDRIRRETESELIVDVAGEPAASARTTEEDPLDLDEDEVVEKYLGGERVPSELMEADEGRILVVKARPTEGTTNVEFSQELVAAVEGMVADLRPASYHPDLVAQVKGDYLQRVGQTTGIRSDVLAGGAFAFGLLLLVIGLYFRRLRAAPAILVPVVVSTLMTQAVGVLLYGTYNLVTTFMFAIVLGLGIEFGIHTLARFGHERERHRGLEEALRVSVASTGRAVLTGGVTTLSVFFLLYLGEFRGFSQFGVMAGIGVLLALLFTFLLLPAIASAIERVRPWTPKPDASVHRVVARTFERIVLPPRVALGLSFAILAASFGVAGWSIARSAEIGFEYDFDKLGSPTKSDPLTEAGKQDYRDAIGRVTTFAPAVALCDTAAQCQQVTRLLDAVTNVDERELARLRGEAVPEPAQAAPTGASADEDDPFAEPDPFEALERSTAGSALDPEQRAALLALGPARVEEMHYFLQGYLSVFRFVPSQQEDKLRVIADIRERIERKIGALEPGTREKAERLLRYLRVTEPVRVEDLPAWVTEQLVDTGGNLGRYAILWNRGAKADYADARRLYDAFFDLPADGGAVPLAANYFVLVEVMHTLRGDGPVVLSAAVLAVLVSLIVFFRSVRWALVTLLPLALAVCWLAGVYLLTGWKLNIFSIIAFPLLIGMSIDQGVHMVHRWLECRDLGVVLRETGAPNALTTVTTVIGFGGLLFADNVGIRTLGLTASLGTVLGLAGALLTTPALLYLIGHLGGAGPHRAGTARRSAHRKAEPLGR